MKRRDFVGGALAALGALAWGKLPLPEAAPPTVEVPFPTGTFLYLDGGTLDLGLVRDSALRVENDFQIFSETFENVGWVSTSSE